jgi:plastocyanin
MRCGTAGRMLGALLLVLVAGTARAEVIQVKIDKVAYTPAQISAHVGDTVEWVNADIVAHTATARDKAWDVMILPNAKKSVVLKAAGSIEYYCKFHPNMIGQITVAQ